VSFKQIDLEITLLPMKRLALLDQLLHRQQPKLTSVLKWQPNFVIKPRDLF